MYIIHLHSILDPDEHSRILRQLLTEALFSWIVRPGFFENGTRLSESGERALGVNVIETYLKGLKHVSACTFTTSNHCVTIDPV